MVAKTITDRKRLDKDGRRDATEARLTGLGQRLAELRRLERDTFAQIAAELEPAFAVRVSITKVAELTGVSRPKLYDLMRERGLR